MNVHPIFDPLYQGLIVSCQALPEEPLYGSSIMAAMAHAAEMGGAVAIRANTPQDISAIRKSVSLPIIGLYKIVTPGYEPFITPTLQSAVDVSQAGAEIIALDATLRPHPNDYSTDRLIREIKQATGKPILADIDSIKSGLAAIASGADALSTTLSGYTQTSPQISGPDYDLLSKLVQDSSVPVFAEGRISTPEQAVLALKHGAFAVIVGGAITRPQQITARFADQMSGYLQEKER
jgi:N-acylglucosamine-6-phosphate 2-epimerase